MASQQTVAPYAASKGGVISFTRSIALDYAADGIRANAVLPGSVETPMLRAAGEQFNPTDPDGAMKNWGALHPLGFLIQPRDIANVIAFLASDEARVITGAPIIADSGLLAGLGV
jgi:NAD(P)-dependent dehydrogenase (short-subunit alcohol dehydrogenase family)